MTNTSELPDLQAVKSSNIRAMGFQDSQMVVEFMNGGIYSYANVSRSVYHEIVTAESVGSVFIRLVKSNPTAYPFTRLN